VDGQTFRLLGNSPEDTIALTQTGLSVTPTKTTYTLKNSQVEVNMSFLAPAIPSNLDLYGRPVNYLSWSVASLDGKEHKIQVYESTSSLLSVNEPTQKVSWKKETAGGLTLLRAGTVDQTLLRPPGDDTRIDWGYVYAGAPTGETSYQIGADAALKAEFSTEGRLSNRVDDGSPRSGNQDEPVLAYAFDLGSVGSTPVDRHMMVGYDELFAIDYYGEKLRPYWRRKGATPESLFQTAEGDYAHVSSEAASFDAELVGDAKNVGGDRYADIVSLAYRECVAANGLAADANGQPLLFTKEDTSNGDIATVDVIFPMDPIWVLLSPTLAKSSLVSNFMYAASPHWKFPNAPHDLGTYPQVTGRDDGGEGMPVEESGNMLLLTDAIAHDENSPEFASKYWPQLTQWANYLEKYGLDPEDQLCTDDFMGHLAHNANLSVKAILALAAYADLCKMRGDNREAQRYQQIAKADAAHWVQVADAGDHSLLAFDKPDTWSQKYNLVWDQILGLGVFPHSVRDREIAYYKRVMLRYGVPLDSRTHLTKTDWSIWSATLANNKEDFEALVSPIWDYLNETTSRDPIADSYITDDVKSDGMHARPVVGGFFVKMLTDRDIWKKWVSRDHSRLGAYAPLPKPVAYEEVVPSGRTGSPEWKYVTSQPPAGWEKPGFDDSNWQAGVAGFGTEGTPAVKIKTKWDTDDIWIRRTLTVPSLDAAKAVLMVFHDEDVEIYINGVLAASEPGYIADYEAMDLTENARKELKPGSKICIAAHCHQTTGGQGIDIGIGVQKP
jgi:hypothetical protein